MRNLYDSDEATQFAGDHADLPAALAKRIYTSRLIGGDADLVLHGGGNTSVKVVQTDLFGEEREVLYVKGSGHDLAGIGPDGFAGLLLDPLCKLCSLESLADRDMEDQLALSGTNPRSPDPSVEALVHAFLPHRFIDHTHADSILVLTNREDGEAMVREVLGAGIAVMPYVMSGFGLAKSLFELYESNPDVEAIVVLNHGIFTFGDDAETSYTRMIDYVGRAEAYIKERTKDAAKPERRKKAKLPADADAELARVAAMLRGACAHDDGDGRRARFVVEARRDADLVEASLSRDAAIHCASGALTPDHVIRTKSAIAFVDALPESDEELCRKVTETVENYRNDYEVYFARGKEATGFEAEMLDPYPRLLLVAGLGLLALGRTKKEAIVAADIGAHNIRAKLRGAALGGYEPIGEEHIFEMEYWPLQRKKLSGKTAPLLGQVAFVTGAAGAIGFGVAESLLQAGAVVAVSDIDEAGLEKVRSTLAGRYGEERIESLLFDVTDFGAVEAAVAEVCRRMGGLDIVVPNAGIAAVAKIEELDPERLDKVVAVNLKGTFNVIKASAPVFRRQGCGGNIVVVSSKNVFDPGAAFGAYSASKAGAHQISKIAALELAELGVRVNMVNPDAVFGDEDISSKLWDLVGPDRMKARGLDAEGLREYYRKRNLLKERVLADHVGNAVVFFASNLTPTTGASLPIDGGIPAAFPR